jgi:predicted GIY-YIG superfamily endonuclease
MKTVRMVPYYVYILASRPGGALYVGVTRDLLGRVAQHKQGLVQGHKTRLIAQSNPTWRDLYEEMI